MPGHGLVGPVFVRLAAVGVLRCQNASEKSQAGDRLSGPVGCKTAQELIVCVARVDRVSDFSKKMIKDWPMPEVPTLVRRYYQLIPYNYSPGPLNSFAMVKKQHPMWVV